MAISKPYTDDDDDEVEALVPGSGRGSRSLGGAASPLEILASPSSSSSAAHYCASGTRGRKLLLLCMLLVLAGAYQLGIRKGVEVEGGGGIEGRGVPWGKTGFRLGGGGWKGEIGTGEVADADAAATPEPTRATTPPPVPTYDPTDSDEEADAAATPEPTRATTPPPVPTYDPTDSDEEASPPPEEKKEEEEVVAGTTPDPTPAPTTGRPEGSWVDPDANPHAESFRTPERKNFFDVQWVARAANAVDIREKYGVYCPAEPLVPMCPEIGGGDGVELAEVDSLVKGMSAEVLAEGPKVPCIETGNKTERCGVTHPWLNKTIWPLIRGPFCAGQDSVRKEAYPFPAELSPYYELGYDRADPLKSVDAEPFDGGAAASGDSLLPFDAATVKDHFLKFEAMLEHYYEGLDRSFLERQLAPTPDDPLYAPMLKAHADQIARAVLRAKGGGDNKLVFGFLGDSVTAGADNCYYDAWPEQLRRQIAPLFGAMGLTVEARNAAKNGGWNLPSQFLCAHDMLGASDRDGLGLDFLFVCNPFVTATALDAEHLVRRALLGESHTVISVTVQQHMNSDDMLSKYAAEGLTVAIISQDAPPELGIPPGHRYWFPNKGKSFWGMSGDGFCHLTTRSGSSAVVNRNWHWGPKFHQTFADAYALMLSRATRLAIDDLSTGRMPPEPRKPGDIDRLLDQPQSEDKPPTWREFLSRDMGTEDAMGGGIGGVRCAIGSANQAGSTLLPHWLRPAEGSPFEETMKARGGTSFVPQNHDAEGSGFYNVQSPITGFKEPDYGDWVPDPKSFGAEAPRTAEQCKGHDGSTMVKMHEPDGVSWLVWEVPVGAVSIGRAMVCHQRNKKEWIAEDAFEKGDIRFHYALPDDNGGWRVIEDVHKSNPVGFYKEECMPVVREMDEATRKAAKEGGMWVAVEWTQDGIFDFDYLVAM